MGEFHSCITVLAGEDGRRDVPVSRVTRLQASPPKGWPAGLKMASEAICLFLAGARGGILIINWPAWTWCEIWYHHHSGHCLPRAKRKTQKHEHSLLPGEGCRFTLIGWESLHFIELCNSSWRRVPVSNDLFSLGTVAIERQEIWLVCIGCKWTWFVLASDASGRNHNGAALREPLFFYNAEISIQ